MAGMNEAAVSMKSDNLMAAYSSHHKRLLNKEEKLLRECKRRGKGPPQYEGFTSPPGRYAEENTTYQPQWAASGEYGVRDAWAFTAIAHSRVPW